MAEEQKPPAAAPTAAPAAAGAPATGAAAAGTAADLPRQQIEDRRIGIGLDGIEHACVRQRLGEGEIVLAHDVEIDDEARSALAVGAQEIHDAIGHSGIPRRAASHAKQG